MWSHGISGVVSWMRRGMTAFGCIMMKDSVRSSWHSSPRFLSIFSRSMNINPFITPLLATGPNRRRSRSHPPVFDVTIFGNRDSPTYTFRTAWRWDTWHTVMKFEIWTNSRLFCRVEKSRRPHEADTCRDCKTTLGYQIRKFTKWADHCISV